VKTNGTQKNVMKVANRTSNSFHSMPNNIITWFCCYGYNYSCISLSNKDFQLPIHFLLRISALSTCVSRSCCYLQFLRFFFRYAFANRFSSSRGLGIRKHGHIAAAAAAALVEPRRLPRWYGFYCRDGRCSSCCCVAAAAVVAVEGVG